MSEVLTRVYGAQALPELEKLAQQAMQGGQGAQMQTLDALAHARAEEMLKVAAEVVEQEQAAEGQSAEGEQSPEEVLDDALTLRALEKLAAENYDVDKIVALLQKAAGR